MNRFILIGWVAAAFVLLTLIPQAALAQTPANGSGEGVALVVDSEPSTAVTFDGLKAALAADLRTRVDHDGGKVALSVRYHDRQLTVRADHGQGRVLERTIEVDPENAEREASLLASNLARDEARELLDDLEARHRPIADVSAPGRTPPAEKKDGPQVYASASFFYPLATNWGEPDARAYFDFTLLWGRSGTVHGAHIGSFAHYVSGEMAGAQVDGFASITKDLSGAQVAGFASIARNEARGFQTAGALAFAREIDGAQAAPVNIAHDVNGLQFGAINIGKRVKGAQVGAINIADEVDGTQLGAISINRDGVHPITFATNLAYTNIGFKFSTKYVYTTFAFVFGTLESDFRQLGTSGAFGGHIPLDAVLEHLDLEPEAVMTHVLPKKGTDIDDNLWLGGRVTAGYNFAKHLRVFAGGGARFPLIVNNGREVARPEALAGVQF